MTAARAVAPVVPLARTQTDSGIAAWHALLTTNRTGGLHATVANAITILTYDWPPHTLIWNEWTTEVESTRRPPWDPIDTYADWCPGRWSEQDDVSTGAWLARTWQLRLGEADVRKAVKTVARKSPRHPLREWLQSLTWDDTPRLSTMLSRYCGAADTPYTRAVGHMMMIGAVARVMDPGCKLDTMIVIEGPQGIGKSTLVRELVGDDYYSDSEIDLASKDRYIALRGRWCIEIAEIDALSRHDTGRVKAFISSAVDTYRAPYARCDEQYPRQCFFVGTTNSDQYLRDTTGNRRFWPVRFGRVRLDDFRRDREQLWAEAVWRHEQGVTWWPDGDLARLCAAEQADRVVTDSWESSIAEWVSTREWVTVRDVLSQCMGLEEARHGQAEQNRVARALAKLGRVKTRRRVGGVLTWGYVDCSDSVPTAERVGT